MRTPQTFALIGSGEVGSRLITCLGDCGRAQSVPGLGGSILGLFFPPLASGVEQGHCQWNNATVLVSPFQCMHGAPQPMPTSPTNQGQRALASGHAEPPVRSILSPTMALYSSSYAPRPPHPVPRLWAPGGPRQWCSSNLASVPTIAPGTE